MKSSLALQIATEAHRGQKDKLGNDYITHPVRVASKFPVDSDLHVVALLHDVLEDHSPTTEGMLREQFSTQVVDAVVAITKKEGRPDLDEHQKLLEYLEYLAQVKANEMALEVKLADIADSRQ